ncbi:MAG: cytochrome c biogenesis CcdA family protein [Thermoleophilaceae bacterium]
MQWSRRSPRRLETAFRTVIGAILFVLGFTLVFALLGASAGLLSGILLGERALLLRAAGVVIVAMALLQISGWRPAVFAPTALAPAPSGVSLAGSLPLGMAFAASWTPCVGPVLAAIVVAASQLPDGMGRDEP